MPSPFMKKYVKKLWGYDMPEYIKETKEEIFKFLTKQKTEEIRPLFELMSIFLISNADLNIIYEGELDEYLEMIEESIGKAVVFSLAENISEEELLLYKEIREIESLRKKVPKKNMVELMSKVLSNDVFFEAICICSLFRGELLEQFFQNMGCENRYRLLSEDEIFKKRREYCQLIYGYAKGVTNLYGVVHVSELLEIILRFEKQFYYDPYESRKGSVYEDTLYYNPYYLCPETLITIIDRGRPDINATLDGLILHGCFVEEYMNESRRFYEHMDANKDNSNAAFEDFFNNLADGSYRRLFAVAKEKEKYVPSVSQLFKFADDEYFGTSKSTEEVKQYLVDHFSKELENTAKRESETTEELLDDIIYSLQKEYARRDVNWDDVKLQDHVYYCFELLRINGIDFDMEEADEFIEVLFRFLNSQRTWFNHGHSAEEMFDLCHSNPFSAPVTIAPDSTEMALLLSKNREEIERRGFKIDFDATADEVPVFPEKGGKVIPFTTATRKVYPKDPCPCGSGKMYKDCCGKS